jgi:hypothetical protein
MSDTTSVIRAQRHVRSSNCVRRMTEAAASAHKALRSRQLRAGLQEQWRRQHRRSRRRPNSSHGPTGCAENSESWIQLNLQFAPSAAVLVLRLLCWFLDAGNYETFRTLREPAPKSAKARSYGKLGTGSAASAMGMPAPMSIMGGTPRRCQLHICTYGGQANAGGILDGAGAHERAIRRCDWAERDRRRRGASATQ